MNMEDKSGITHVAMGHDLELEEVSTSSRSVDPPNEISDRLTSSHEPPDGTIVLAKGSNTEYVTCYRIGREEQRRMIQDDVAMETCPCCFRGQSRSFFRTLWQFVKSEPFLLVLNILALLFSVLKKTVPDLDIDHDIEKIHGSIETVIAVSCVSIRLVAGYEKFHEEKVFRTEIEHCTDSVRSHSLKLMMRSFYMIGIFLIVVLVITFAVFLVYDKLYWTIITTNLVLVLGGIGGNLVMRRLERMVGRIIEDQHKAIIYESILLLAKCTSNYKGDTGTERNDSFCKAVRNTKLLENKGHIFQNNSQPDLEILGLTV